MAKNLVIVESPAKAKTIEKFLGKDFHVMSSYGHIRDLKKKDFGIDINNNFKPLYEVPTDKKKIVSELKKEAKTSEIVWLASDEDREGEAISWHLLDTLGLKDSNTKRIVFHEITKEAILNAIKNPRNINYALVDAQQARRVLDRIVGFELSPILWRKIKPSLSAGRVQSVAVRLIVDREREISNFKTESSYRVIAIFNKKDGKKQYEFKAEYNKRFKTKKEAYDLLESLKNSTFKVSDITTKPSKRNPSAPFTTSTLQQEASRKLGFNVSLTMMIAQKLYESGKITYMRTDSLNLSSFAIEAAKLEINNVYGEKYLKPRKYTTKSKGAQEAHEAIRPTDMSQHSVSGTDQEKKLYDLIWKRTIASQMADAEFEKTIITIIKNNDSDPDGKFITTGKIVKFDGFLKAYLEGTDDDLSEPDDTILTPINKNEELTTDNITADERFSHHPPRFTEASLVHKMEELGIGRPSTYAPTISTIQKRGYIEKKNFEGEQRDYNLIVLQNNNIKEIKNTEITGSDKNKFAPTDIGTVVNDYLVENFSNIIDYNFTAKVEHNIDKIAEGKVLWNDTIRDFYQFFHETVENAINKQEKHRIGERILGVDPNTGKQLSVKIGRYGPFVQIGTSEDEEKPIFASLLKSQSIEKITLEEALKLFKLPRALGEYENDNITVSIGRFGPYIKHNNKFVSIPKDIDPMALNIEQAIILIEEKKNKDKERIFKTFKEDADLQILTGRYGQYIYYNKSNYKIPKDIGIDIDKLTYNECINIVNSSDSKKKSSTKKSPSKAVSEKKVSTKTPSKGVSKKKVSTKKSSTKRTIK